MSEVMTLKVKCKHGHEFETIVDQGMWSWCNCDACRKLVERGRMAGCCSFGVAASSQEDIEYQYGSQTCKEVKPNEGTD
jgi:hypothetical protein